MAEWPPTVEPEFQHKLEQASKKLLNAELVKKYRAALAPVPEHPAAAKNKQRRSVKARKL